MGSVLSDLLKFQTDFSQGGILRFVIALVAAMIYGLLLAIVYNKYYRANEPQDASIARSFPLMSPGVTMIFWLIQFSLPLSLGLLGALSFVRFRTPVKRAEDISFILILIAGSLACAVGYFLSVIILLLLAFAYSSSRSFFTDAGSDNAFAILTIHSKQELDLQTLDSKLKAFAGNVNLISSGCKDSINSYVINLGNFDKTQVDKIKSEVKQIAGDAVVDLFFPNNQIGGY